MKKLTSESSKEEELQYFAEIVNAVESGTYLAGIVNRKMFDEFERNTRNDFPTEPLVTIADQNKEIAILADERYGLKRKMEDLNKKLMAANTEINCLMDLLTRQENITKNAEEERDHFNIQAQKAEEANRRLQEEITRLKVQVYDLTFTK